MCSSWDEVYAGELANHINDPTDEGTIWFDENRAEDRIIQCLSGLVFPCAQSDLRNEDCQDLRILDVGTGNGHLLFELLDEGWQAELVGVDYSESSVELARNVGSSRRRDDSDNMKDRQPGITFAVWNAIHDSPGQWCASGFDVVLDKGTFDAISLSDERIDQNGRRGHEVYAAKLTALMKPAGYLLVTSCNWTEEELRIWFEGDNNEVGTRLHFYKAVKFPDFEFAGKKGQSVSCVCFQKTVSN